METLLLVLPVLILSIVVHEYAHAWVARTQGDRTAEKEGRLTLNPLVHLDPFGSVLVPGILALSAYAAGFPNTPVLGWAKPVPVTTSNFRNYRRGDILVSLAGVAANFALAILLTIILAVVARVLGGLGAVPPVVLQMLLFGIQINFMLILFNLLPIPPLDGSHLFYHLLPPHLGTKYRAVGGYGMLVLFGLLFLGGLRYLYIPVVWMTISTLRMAGLGI